MVYISANGSVGERQSFSSNPLRYLSDAFFSLSGKGKAAVVVCLAVACHLWQQANHPLAWGRIPAAKVEPQNHWKYISKDPMLVRTMTDYLSTRTNAKLERNMRDRYVKSDRIDVLTGKVDFGGHDGHELEGGDWGTLEELRGTRCSSTRSALTAYFCGAQVARNHDLVLETERKHSNRGLQTFADFISCRHAQGERNEGNHRRSVYRLGIGCEDTMAGYSHAFTIVAQPDGTFFWLQSFIGRYSLAKWMEQVDSDSGSPRGHLSLAQLQAKLQQVDRLMKIDSWTHEANSDYHELFWVDMEKEAVEKNKLPVSSTWKMSHRLHQFSWDEACEYPLPSSKENPPNNTDSEATNMSTNDDDADKNDSKDDTSVEDECLAAIRPRLFDELVKEVLEASVDS